MDDESDVTIGALAPTMRDSALFVSQGVFRNHYEVRLLSHESQYI